VTDETGNLTASLRTAMARRLPAPTGSYRARAWKRFEHALTRHLARRRPFNPLGNRH
jgi:hypothetical protein